MKTFIIGKTLRKYRKLRSPIDEYKIQGHTKEDALARYHSMFKPSHMWLLTCREA